MEEIRCVRPCQRTVFERHAARPHQHQCTSAVKADGGHSILSNFILTWSSQRQRRTQPATTLSTVAPRSERISLELPVWTACNGKLVISRPLRGICHTEWYYLEVVAARYTSSERWGVARYTIGWQSIISFKPGDQISRENRSSDVLIRRIWPDLEVNDVSRSERAASGDRHAAGERRSPRAPLAVSKVFT